MPRITAFRRLSAFGLVTLGLVFALAGPASAHADLATSIPTDGATLMRAPRALTLTFTEGVEVRDDGIRLIDASGADLDIGLPTHPGGRSTVVGVPLPRLGDGLYVVAWRAVSEDAHPIRGSFTFSVGMAHVSGTHAELLEKAVLSEGSGDPAVGVVFGIARFSVFLGLALLLGGGWFAAYLWPEGRRDPRVRSLLIGSLALTGAATVLGFLLQGPYTSGGGFGDMVAGDQISAVLETNFGVVWLSRLAMLVVAAALLRMMVRHEGPLPGWWFGAGALTGLALSATPGLAGHASTGRWILLALPADMFHVLGMAVWFGGLVMLAIARTDEDSYGRVAERFSGLALGAVVLLVITGTFQAIRQLQPISALWDSDYGRLLIAKLVGFALILLIAAWSRRLVHGPGMGIFGADAAPLVRIAPEVLAEAPQPAPVTPRQQHRLKRSVRGELIFGGVVLALTSMLVNTSPPQVMKKAAPFERVVNAGPVKFDLFLGPAEVGANNALHVTVLSRSLEHADALEVRASISMPSRDIPPIAIQLESGDHGHFSAENVAVPFAGDWTLEVHALLTEVDDVSASVTVPVG